IASRTGHQDPKGLAPGTRAAKDRQRKDRQACIAAMGCAILGTGKGNNTMSQTVSGAVRIGTAQREVVVCAMARSPFGRFDGMLAPLTLPELGAQVIDALLARSGVEPDAIEALYTGIGLAGGAMLTATRQMLLRSVLPQTLPSAGIDRACCSGITAISQAARDIAFDL